MTETHIPRFGGLFMPARLVGAPAMSILDKVLLVQIECLTRRGVGCIATDAYLAAAFGVKEPTIAAALQRLDDRGLIAVTHEGGGRVLRLTRQGAAYWFPEAAEPRSSAPRALAEGGDGPCGSGSPSDTSGKGGKGAAFGAPSPSPSEKPDTPAPASTTANGSTGTAADPSCSPPPTSGRSSSEPTTTGSPSDPSGTPSKPEKCVAMIANIPCDDGDTHHIAHLMNARPHAPARTDEKPYSQADSGTPCVNDSSGAGIVDDDDEDTYIPSSSSRRPSGTTATPTASPQSDSRRQRREVDDEIRKQIDRLNATASRVWALVTLVKKNGRDATYVRAWIDYAEKHAQNPGGYATRMIEENKDLPHTVTRPAPADDGYCYNGDDIARANAARRKEAGATSHHSGVLGYERIDDPEGEAALAAVREKLREETKDTPPPTPRLTPEQEAEQKEKMAAARREIDELARKKSMKVNVLEMTG